jgi:type I restriction enzyme S subunit
MSEASGRLPVGWSWATGEDLFEFLRGISYKKADVLAAPLEDSVTILRAGNLQDGRIVFDDLVHIPASYVHEEQRIRKGDLIIAMSSGSASVVGKVAVADKDMPRVSFGAFCGLLRPRTKEYGHWLSEFFQTKNYRDLISSLAAGININNLRREHLYTLSIRVPPISEMQRLEKRIEVLQEWSRRAREALSEVGPLLEQLRQSVLAAAFRGDLTADWRVAHPNVDPASQLLHRIRSERRRRWEQAELAKYEAKNQKPPKDWQDKYKEPKPVDDSDLSALPDGWCWARWDEVGFCQNGRAFPSKNYALTGVKLLRPGNLHVSGQVVWTPDNTRYMPTEWEYEDPAYVVGPNELIMNLTAQSLKDEFLGRICLTSEDEHCILNQRLARITPVLLSSEFCLILFKSPVFRRYVDTLNTGSLIQHMFTSQVDEFVFPLPPYDEQLALIASVTRNLQLKNSVESLVLDSHRELETLDQAILAKAFRGELVPQDPSDEPASVLLERIRAQRQQQAEATKKTSKTQRRNKMGKSSSGLASQHRPLVEVLTTKGQPMPPEQLLTESGYNDDCIEDFYLTLREEIAKGRIRENRPTQGNVMLEAIE